MHRGSFVPLEFGNIRQPLLIGHTGVKLPVQPIPGYVLWIGGLPCAAVVLVLNGGLNIQTAADTKYSFLVHIQVVVVYQIVFDTAVTVDDYTPGTNVFRQPFLLQDYLKFGIVTADTEAALLEKVSTRAKAQAAATARLGNYTSDTAQLEAGKETYMALVVYMPQETGNHANYRGQAPTVKLGVIIEARQLGMPNG